MKIYKHIALLSVVGLSLAACGPATTPPAEPDANVATVDEASTVAEAVVEEAAPAVETPAAAVEEAKPMEEAPATDAPEAEMAWVSLFNGENLDGWTPHGAATWEVKDGVITGQSPGGQGHLYAAPELTDLEIKGMYKITDLGGGANSGMYFRANPPADNVDGYPEGYEAQICHNQDAHTGWLWKPGTPTGKAEKLLTKDGEWFSMRVKMVGTKIQIWVQDELVMTYEDGDYAKGFFALQCHNDGMMVEAKDLFYRDLSAK